MMRPATISVFVGALIVTLLPGPPSSAATAHSRQGSPGAVVMSGTARANGLERKLSDPRLRVYQSPSHPGRYQRVCSRDRLYRATTQAAATASGSWTLVRRGRATCMKIPAAKRRTLAVGAVFTDLRAGVLYATATRITWRNRAGKVLGRLTLAYDRARDYTCLPLGGCTVAAKGRGASGIVFSARTGGQPTFPIRAAFYYPWFPEAWTQGGVFPFTHYRPTRGYYDGKSRAVVRAQVDDMTYAGMDAGIASWWGQGSKEDLRIPRLLAAAEGTPFKWAVYHEPEGYGDPTVGQLSSDIAHIVGSFGASASYLKVGGRPVIFAYADAADACGMADRWKSANSGRAFVVLKVFSGYRSCATQPEEWHQYAPAVARDSQGAHSFSVSPGFWLKGQAERLPRDAARFEADVAAMAASGARWQLVTTYNEWGEGTSVEGATQWSSASTHGTYVDILRKHLVATVR